MSALSEIGACAYKNGVRRISSGFGLFEDYLSGIDGVCISLIPHAVMLGLVYWCGFSQAYQNS